MGPITLDDEKTAACVTAGTIGGDISMLKALFTDQRLTVPSKFNAALNSFLSGAEFPALAFAIDVYFQLILILKFKS